MGGYGSGRPQTRPGASEALALPVSYAAAKLRQLRRERAAGDELPGLLGGVSWSRGSGAYRQPAGSLLYTVGEDEPGGPWCELRYSLAGAPVVERLRLVERPSNLGRGAVLYWRCPRCAGLARILYNPRGRYGCRRCARVVYDSSRDSDGRVSALLAEAAQAAHLDHVQDRDPVLLGTLAVGELLQVVRGQMGGPLGASLMGFKALERIGLGFAPDKRPRWHGSMGKPRGKR